jgi:hypothetical protein
MPKSRPNSWVNTIATASVEVTSGASTPIRYSRLARSPRLSALASSSASSSCGTVEITKMPMVLTTEFQNCGSSTISR